MTELSAVAFCSPQGSSLVEDSSTVGTLLPHTSAKVIDNNGSTLPPNHVGELCISGYLMHCGYYKNMSKTAEILETDSRGRQWLHTGDLVVISHEGLCRVVGRCKDVIKKGLV